VTTAYINRIATAVPPNDVHRAFVRFAEHQLRDDRRGSILFKRMAEKGGIDHRYSYVLPSDDPGSDRLDAAGLFHAGSFPDTAKRMRFFEDHAPVLAAEAVDRLQLGAGSRDVTHLLITCCTGLSSPGIDLELLDRCDLPGSVERSVIGFMGCYAAINALRLAHHIVRSDDQARVLVVSLELTTIHLKDTRELEQMLTFLLWGDGASAALVTADEQGFGLDSFKPVLAPGTRELITWNIRQQGFDMLLSGAVPGAIQQSLGESAPTILGGMPVEEIDLWAVHPGGRSVLDAVERALRLNQGALAESRQVLRDYGNMSSATVMFVLAAMLQARPSSGAQGCAMSFGPGLVAETMRFHAA